ncbi:glucosaminidase domain-containing protein [Paenibacillus sp. R14(2021)]|uniref:glucosaminidase domain-containing protein n=1 Tax=Paenibacillus sp. R14(2021) TaxID=2859228 RepID=UPI001C6136A1|nr:glucosaminidase domain-containing protein [Paenibacillus sp. R14(2021)]
MLRSIQWNVMAYMISAALLASLFLSFNLTSTMWNKGTAEQSFPQWYGNRQTMPVASQSVTSIPSDPSLLSVPKTNLQPAAVSPRISPAAQASAQAKTIVPPITKPLHTYKVTSFYLNVREMPSADSKILREVKQGTLLEVLTATESGWLSLKEGGFVHGRYAVPVAEAAAPMNKSLASTQTIVPIGATLPLTTPASSAPAANKTSITALPSKAMEQEQSPPVTDGIAATEAGGNPVKPSSKVMSDSGLTKAHIALILKGTKLEGQGLEEAVLGIEEKYGINAFFTIAVMKLESGNGKSKLARTKNNLFGLNATGNGNVKAYAFATKGDCVRKFGQLISDNYVERGFTTIEKVGGKYCPANGRWAGHVRSIMRSDFSKLI